MFDIVSARDFYAMLVEDFDDFMDEPHVVRRALHCAISAYHLHDWIWADWLKPDAELRERLGIGTKKADFQQWLFGRSIWFSMVGNLANGTKHSAELGGFRSIRVVAAPFSFDTFNAGLDEGAWDGPICYGVSSTFPVGPDGKGYLIFDLGEPEPQPADANPYDFGGSCFDVPLTPSYQRWMPVAHVLEAVVRMWRDFIRMHWPNEDIPVSRHHVD